MWLTTCITSEVISTEYHKCTVFVAYSDYATMYDSTQDSKTKIKVGDFRD